MNNKAIMGMELEKRVFDIFTRLGWECVMSDSPMSFDITLTKNNELYGYVEIYLCTGVNSLKRKIERITRAIEDIKPPVFILTDGITFETYFDGLYFDTMTLPIGYNEFSKRNTLISKHDDGVNKNG